MENTNQEVLNQGTTELTVGEKFLTPDSFVKVQLPTGKWTRKMIYSGLNTVPVPVTQEEKKVLFNILNGKDDSDAVVEAKKAVGTIFELEDVIIQPYDKVNEDTGELEYGAVTYLFEKGNPKPFVTSSKSVYMTLKNLFVAFGVPRTKGYMPITVSIVERKGHEHKYIDLQLI